MWLRYDFGDGPVIGSDPTSPVPGAAAAEIGRSSLRRELTSRRPVRLPTTARGRTVGKRAITTEPALCLSKALGVDDRFWINIQTDYDLEVERDLHSDELAKVTALVAS
jgi:hypothetical protein